MENGPRCPIATGVFSRLSDLPELRERAEEVLRGLEKGKI